jgi:hypothetical protein
MPWAVQGQLQHLCITIYFKQYNNQPTLRYWQNIFKVKDQGNINKTNLIKLDSWSARGDKTIILNHYLVL